MRAWHCPRCRREWRTEDDCAGVYHECAGRRLTRSVALPPLEAVTRDEARQRIWATYFGGTAHD